MVIKNSHAKRFAKYHNIPIIIWPEKLSGPYIDSLSREELNSYKRYEPLLQEVFVKGAEAYISNNINGALGLVNGSKVVLHLITLSHDSSPQQIMNLRHKIDNHNGDNIIYLEEPHGPQYQ